MIIEVEPKAFGIKCNGQEVTGVTAGSQADKAGVKKGWKVLTIGGKEVSTTAEITKGLADGKKGGKKYKIEFEAPKGDGAAAVLAMGAGRGKKAAAADGKVTINVEPKSFGIKCNGQSVTTVTAGSQAEKAGVKVGWKVLEIAGKKVSTTKDITNALADNRKKGKAYKIIVCVGDGGAVSTKEATEEGHKVTTVAEGAVATAAAPEEPAAASEGAGGVPSSGEANAAEGAEGETIMTEADETAEESDEETDEPSEGDSEPDKE